MLEIAPEDHGAQNKSRILDYVSVDSDPVDIQLRDDFIFFVNEVKKFGFMVDKHAPWRLVFNLASGRDTGVPAGSEKGAKKYMSKFAVNFDNIFETYYRKAYLDEHLNLKNKFYSLYEAFYSQFGTYETVLLTASRVGDSPTFTRSCVVRERFPREPPPSVKTSQSGTSFTFHTYDWSDSREEDEYWLKVLLKLRLAETQTIHDVHNFNFYATESVRLYRLFGLEAGLQHINKLTKGLHVVNFLNEGSFWYGISQKEYENKKQEAVKNAEKFAAVDYSLTGTKNVK